MFEPPTLTLVYSVDGKLRKRTMPVRKLHGDSDPVKIATALAAAHPSLLAPHIVSAAQLERLVRRLIEHRRKQVQEEDERERERQREQMPPQFSGNGSSGGGTNRTIAAVDDADAPAPSASTAAAEPPTAKPPPASMAAGTSGSGDTPSAAPAASETSRPLQSLSKPGSAPLPRLQPLAVPQPPPQPQPPPPQPPQPPLSSGFDEAEELEEVEDFEDDFEEETSPASSPPSRSAVSSSAKPPSTLSSVNSAVLSSAVLSSAKPPSTLSSGPPPERASFGTKSFGTAAATAASAAATAALSPSARKVTTVTPPSPQSSLKSTLQAYEEDLSSSAGEGSPQEETRATCMQGASAAGTGSLGRPLGRPGATAAAAAAATDDVDDMDDVDDDDVDALLDDLMDESDNVKPKPKPSSTQPVVASGSSNSSGSSAPPVVTSRIPRLDAAANGHRTVPPPAAPNTTPPSSSGGGATGAAADEPTAVAKVGALLAQLGGDGGDLQSVSEEALLRAKQAMEATFESNRLRPGDPGYVHDKRVRVILSLSLTPTCLCPSSPSHRLPLFGRSSLPQRWRRTLGTTSLRTLSRRRRTTHLRPHCSGCEPRGVNGRPI